MAFDPQKPIPRVCAEYPMRDPQSPSPCQIRDAQFPMFGSPWLIVDTWCQMFGPQCLIPKNQFPMFVLDTQCAIPNPRPHVKFGVPNLQCLVPHGQLHTPGAKCLAPNVQFPKTSPQCLCWTPNARSPIPVPMSNLGCPIPNVWSPVVNCGHPMPAASLLRPTTRAKLPMRNPQAAKPDHGRAKMGLFWGSILALFLGSPFQILGSLFYGN